MFEGHYGIQKNKTDVMVHAVNLTESRITWQASAYICGGPC